MVDEDAPHHHGGQSDELRTVSPVHVPLIDHSDVGFVHESGRLQRVAGPFAPEVVSGKMPELVINKRQHPVAGDDVAGTGRDEEGGGPAVLAGIFHVGGLPEGSYHPSVR